MVSSKLQTISALDPDQRRAKGDATREIILLTAERLFAESGIAAVSLRDVAAAAGQKNNAAVHYHFGDKDTLLREILRFRLKTTDEVCLDILAKVAKKAEPDVADYVGAFVGSLASNLVKGNYFVPFFARFMTEGGGISMIADMSPARTVAVFIDVWRRLFPNLSDAIVKKRWQILIESVVSTLANYQTSLEAGKLSEPLDELLEDLILFHAAGLAAPRRRNQK